MWLPRSTVGPSRVYVLRNGGSLAEGTNFHHQRISIEEIPFAIFAAVLLARHQQQYNRLSLIMLDPRKYRNGGAFLVMLLTTLGTNILGPSLLPLLEQSVCRSYYLLHNPATVGKDGSVPEMKCKGSEIQKDLASLAGWSQFFALFPGML